MSSSPLGGGRLRAFRLSEVPPGLRERHANRLIKQSDSPIERMHLGFAAHRPTERVYMVSREAWDRVMGG